MEYGIMVNNQLIRHKEYHDGDKLIVYTDEPVQDGYYATHYWAEEDDRIVQKWELHEAVDEPEPEEEELTAEEALGIITGGTA